MKRIFISLVFLCFALNSYNQVIKGTVYDSKDKKPVVFAYVYIGGTMVVTTTDNDGFFKLDISKYRGLPVTISALGYYQFTLKDFQKPEPVKIFLTPKIVELEEVVVSDKSLARKRKEYLKTFRSAFLGTTSNGSLSTILNEEDLHFNYNSRDTIKAYASRPMKIENRGLGYNVTYFLEEFEYNRSNDSFYFFGNILFEEDLNTDESLKQRYEWRRKKAFLGSKMHFFRSLWNNCLDSTGYQITDSRGKRLNYEDIITDEDGTFKYIWYPEELIIFYQTSVPAGIIYLKKDPLFFDKSGFFDPLNVAWAGSISDQRIGDWLPYEYVPPE
jgi:hypothetical protein